MGIIYNFVRHAFLLEMWLEKSLMREQLNRRPNLFETSDVVRMMLLKTHPPTNLDYTPKTSEVSPFYEYDLYTDFFLFQFAVPVSMKTFFVHKCKIKTCTKFFFVKLNLAQIINFFV